MFALVIDGTVQGVSAFKREVAGGKWLPIVEDEATFSLYGEQKVSGYTIQKRQVKRHWKQVQDISTRLATLEKARAETEEHLASLADAVDQPQLAALVRKEPIEEPKKQVEEPKKL